MTGCVVLLDEGVIEESHALCDSSQVRPSVTLLALCVALLSAGPAAAAESRIVSLDQSGRQSLAGGYERVYGIAHGVSPATRTCAVSLPAVSATASSTS